MLRTDLEAPRKQRHTIERILERLAGEHDFELAAYSTVRDYVAKRRPGLMLEAKEGRRHLEGTVLQAKRPGEEAEVDFADVWLDLAGQRRKCVLFTLRMSYSGKAVHRVYATASQEAFFEGHVEAFEALGGVPTVHIRSVWGRRRWASSGLSRAIAASRTSSQAAVRPSMVTLVSSMRLARSAPSGRPHRGGGAAPDAGGHAADPGVVALTRSPEPWARGSRRFPVFPTLRPVLSGS
jgi:hypothetical protein